MKFLVKKQQIDCIERDKLADGQIAFVSFRFVFDNEWEGLYKVVQFMQGENTYNISLGVDGYSCKMPSELQAGCAEMSLFGYAPDDETALRATTAPIKLRIEQSGFSSSGSEIVPPTPDLYQQLIAKIDEKIASVHDGADGASAYEIAVENGYTGTEAEWLTSLKGQKGERGEKGEKGDTGEQGLQGIQGEKGEKGDTGAAGKDGMNGTDGRDGANGFSPTVIVTETSTGATITATDKNGTTTATIKNGTSGETASWGDYTQGCEEGESAKYCTAKLVTVTGKQTWQVLPSISTVSHNALDIVPDGLFVLDLSPDVDTLKESAHTHENKKLLDRIQKNEQVHQHSNMSVLQTITQEQVNNWQDSDRIAHYHNNKAVLDTITQELYFNWCEGYSRSVFSTQAIEKMQSAITVYVNAAAGSNSNNGNTSGTAFQTLEKALDAVSYCKKAIIYLAAGTYTIPDKTVTFLGKDIRIYGNTAEDTIVQGNIAVENSYVRLARITLNSTDSETAVITKPSVTATYRATVRINDCNLNSAGTIHCVGSDYDSKVCCSNVNFYGSEKYAVIASGSSDIRVFGCKDYTGTGALSGGNCIVYLTNSTNNADSNTTEFLYKSTNYGMVYVNGQQVLPQTAETAAILSMGGNV